MRRSHLLYTKKRHSLHTMADEKLTEKQSEHIDETKPQASAPSSDASAQPEDKAAQRKNSHFLAMLIVVTIASVVLLYVYSVFTTSSPAERYADANALIQKGQIDKGIRQLELLATEGSDSAKMRLYRLYLMNDSVQPNYENGIAYLTEMAPKDTNALMDIIRLYFGNNMKGKRFFDVKKAEYYADLAIQRHCYLGRVYFVKGWCSSNRGDFKRAAYWWEKSVANGFFMANDNLGWYHNINGEHTEALACFDKVLAQKPDDAYALYNRGLYFFENGATKDEKRQGIADLMHAAEQGSEAAQEIIIDLQRQHVD